MSLFGFSGKKKTEYIIVGLGNPTPKYENTRHNAGFMAIDCLARRNSVDMTRKKFNAWVGDGVIAEKRCLLLKPLTFMNNSGEAVEAAARFYKIPYENIIVLYDDISLDVGRVRVRAKGSDGGHNGIKSIIAETGSDNFPRVKIGVGKKPNPNYDLAKWVLSEFRSDELPRLGGAVENAASAVETMLCFGAEKAMNDFNNKAVGQG